MIWRGVGLRLPGPRRLRFALAVHLYLPVGGIPQTVAWFPHPSIHLKIFRSVLMARPPGSLRLGWGSTVLLSTLAVCVAGGLPPSVGGWR